MMILFFPGAFIGSVFVVIFRIQEPLKYWFWEKWVYTAVTGLLWVGFFVSLHYS